MVVRIGSTLFGLRGWHRRSKVEGYLVLGIVQLDAKRHLRVRIHLWVALDRCQLFELLAQCNVCLVLVAYDVTLIVNLDQQLLLAVLAR